MSAGSGDPRTTGETRAQGVRGQETRAQQDPPNEGHTRRENPYRGRKIADGAENFVHSWTPSA